MSRVAQIGIAIGALGAILMVMSLFPGMTGLAPTPGLGIVQIFGFLVGFIWLILGALFYAKFAFYAGRKSNLAQQIGVRLALTGMVLAVLVGLADPLGFGSHGLAIDDESYFGQWQTFGIVGCYLISCIGVLIYAVTGNPTPSNTNSESLTPNHESPAADKNDPASDIAPKKDDEPSKPL